MKSFPAESIDVAKGSRERGQAIETATCNWLGTQGLTLLERNFVRRIGEIDLIMREAQTELIVFVEVRYRESDTYGGALESIDTRKQSRLLRTASAWLQQNADERTNARFDVIAVSPESGRAQRPPLLGELHAVSWKGLSIIWIRDAFQSV